MNEQLVTRHAKLRAQQRAIPPLIVEWLETYGAIEVDHRGAEIRYFDQKARRRLGKVVGHQVVGLLGRLLDAYAVVGKSGAVITVGHRIKRINRH